MFLFLKSKFINASPRSCFPGCSFIDLFTRSVLLFFVFVFLFSSLVVALPWQPNASAARERVSFFAVQPGEKTDQSQKEVINAFNEGDNYDHSGWRNVAIYVEDLMGLGPQALEFNQDLSKNINCKDIPGPDACRDREPVFTKTIYCSPSAQGQPFSVNRPADSDVYYEIVYAVGLKENGSKGNEFLVRDDFNGVGGYADVIRYSKSNPDLVTYDVKEETRKFNKRGGLATGNHTIDHLNNNDNKSNKSGTFGVLDGESACQPLPSFKKDMIMANYNKMNEDEQSRINPSGVFGGGEAGDGESVGELQCMQGSLGWIICPIVEMLNSAIATIDSMITTLLTISPDNFNHTCQKSNGNQLDAKACSRAKAYYSAWSSFRTLALGIVVIAALVAITSTALGYEIFDAYTIRKILPRIIFTIIFIALSWHILSFFVVLTNDIGNGIRWLIYQPFLNADIYGVYFDWSNFGFTAIFGLVGIGAGVVAAAIYGPAIFLFLLAGAIIIIAAVLIMILRELIVILLVIMAPIGIACYILPNTQKGWQLWQNTLTTMLLAFPIIAAIITFGRVFAAASYVDNDALRQFVALVAYFIPYLLIPYSFKLAGGAIAGLANIANNAERGVFDRMRKIRQNKAAYNIQRMKDGERFNNKLLNTATSRATTSRFGLGKRGRAAYEQKMALAAIRHAKSDAGQAGQYNDDMLRAQTYESAAQARERMAADWGMDQSAVESAIAAAKAGGGFGKNRQYYAAQQLAATGTGYDNIRQVAETIGRVSNGNAAIRGALAGNINSTTKQQGRFDLAPGAGNLSTLSEHAGNGTATMHDYHTATVNAVRGVDAVSMLRGKPRQVEHLTKSLAGNLRSSMSRAEDTSLSQAEREAAMDEALQTAAQIRQLDDSKGYASQQNQEYVNNMMRDTRDLAERLRPQVERSQNEPASRWADRWDELSTRQRNPNDPNLP